MSEQIIVIGGGGHAKVVIDCIRSAGDTVAGILDDSLAVGGTVLHIPVLGKTEDYVRFADKKFIVAIGNNAVRVAWPRTWMWNGIRRFIPGRLYRSMQNSEKEA